MFCTLELFLIFSSIAASVAGVPSWVGGMGMQTQTSIGNIVPGASFIEAIGSGISYEQYRPKYLSVAAEKGVPGPAVVHENLSPPLFYIYQQQLWQLTNQTSILRVNVLNTTDVEGHFAPLKLELGEKKEGVSGGIWRWRGTMLHYDLGQKSNKGLYYSCESKSGMRGVYMSIDPGPAPEGCYFTTLHSFVSRLDDGKP